MDASLCPYTPPPDLLKETGPGQGEVLGTHLPLQWGFGAHTGEEGLEEQLEIQLLNEFTVCACGQNMSCLGPQFLHLWDGVSGVAHWVRITGRLQTHTPGTSLWTCGLARLGSGPRMSVKNKPTNRHDGFEAQLGLQVLTLGCRSYSAPQGLTSLFL